MRRRLVITIAGAILAAVAVVGAGTLLLTTVDAQHRDQEELTQRLTDLATVVSEVRAERRVPVAQQLEPTLGADTLDVVLVDPGTPLLTEEDVEELQAGRTVSRRDGNTVIAAAPFRRREGAPPVRALLATDSSETKIGPAGRWFLIVGALTVAVGTLVALRLARRLTGPLVDAEEATQRIARGELGTRVEEPSHAEDELSRLVRSINTMAAALEQARTSEHDFLLSVSHDLRTPLTSIGGWAEALADGNAPDPRMAGATILAEAGRLDRLVRDLLDLARLRAQTFTLTLRPVDLRDVAIGAGEGLRPDLEDAGLALSFDLTPGPVVVQGDADRLAQVAGNLVENAGRHASSRVHLIVTVDGDDAVLAVDDDGPGIPAADRDKVFDRLYSQSPQGSRAYAGTGVGLATVRALAEAMDGTVFATQTPEGGARLVVRLPLGGFQVQQHQQSSQGPRVRSQR